MLLVRLARWGKDVFGQILNIKDPKFFPIVDFFYENTLGRLGDFSDYFG